MSDNFKLNVPTLVTASPFNPSAMTGIERLSISLAPTTTGEGKKMIVTGRRYMYLYPDSPDFLFLSDARLFTEERGIPVFWLKYFHETGLVFLKPPNQEIMDMITLLLDGLQSADIFNSLSSAYSLKALLGMRYISPRCLQESLNLASYSQAQYIQAAEIAKEMDVPSEVIAQLQLTDAYNQLTHKALKAANESEPSQTQAITQESRDTKPISHADTGNLPDTRLGDDKASTAKSQLNPDTDSEGKLDITTAEGDISIDSIDVESVEVADTDSSDVEPDTEPTESVPTALSQAFIKAQNNKKAVTK
jgi:hypothetical protein